MVRVERPYQLLIADDDSGFRETLRTILEPCFQLVEADSGERAIAIIEHQPVDVVLLDMHMHELTGLETLRVIKTVNEMAPCILITADVTDDLVRDAEDAEAFSVLSKPVTKTVLVTTVHTAMTDVYDDPDALAPLMN
ncbi:MAG: response regulator [Planctomycetaceae bacterium]